MAFSDDDGAAAAAIPSALTAETAGVGCDSKMSSASWVMALKFALVRDI